MTKPNTKERILDTAVDLFYSKGYVNTGVEEIINTCDIKKPTLYYYFESKAALGLAYLDFKEAEFLGILDRLSKRSESLSDFFIAWTTLIERAARTKKYYGCPFGSFASQLSSIDRSTFESKLRLIKKRWLEMVISILEKYSPKRKKKPEDLREMALEVMVVYEGAANLYRMTGEIEFIYMMRKQFEQITKRN
ncbi:TetR/AcrR family transcriptional regulator [Leptospira sp. 'Mane']|uniref:TetR/AcrR family transcriptional regulator n=1 Tax=Leptospira sp. 'Mane' TaxID=3387407 RepID=UPI00398B1889